MAVRRVVSIRSSRGRLERVFVIDGTEFADDDAALAELRVCLATLDALGTVAEIESHSVATGPAFDWLPSFRAWAVANGVAIVERSADR